MVARLSRQLRALFGPFERQHTALLPGAIERGAIADGGASGRDALVVVGPLLATAAIRTPPASRRCRPGTGGV